MKSFNNPSRGQYVRRDVESVRAEATARREQFTAAHADRWRPFVSYARISVDGRKDEHGV
jgi:hypothetical protein